MSKEQKLPVRRTVQNLLIEHKASLQSALPKHMTADRMIRVVLTAMTTQPLLEKCTIPSLLRATLECAQLGLEPDGVLGDAYLVPFKNKRGEYEAKTIPGYRGYIKLARRSGDLLSLDADVICSEDLFGYQKGSEPYLHHQPPLHKDRGEVIGAYACARLKNGGIQFEVLSRKEIEAIQSSSKAGSSGSWKTHWNAMAKKTAIRQLAKYLSLSPELTQMAVREEYIEQGIETPDLTPDEDAAGLIAAATDARKDELREKYSQDASVDQHAGETLQGDEEPEPGSAG